MIERFQINVTYDTDLEKARKLIKKIRQEPAEGPDSPATSLSRSRCKAWNRSVTSQSKSVARLRPDLASSSQSAVERTLSSSEPSTRMGSGLLSPPSKLLATR